MKKRILFIGDSLIEFFDWAERFREHEVYNFGIAGETVEGLKSRLPHILNKVNAPDFVFIMSGINNMAMGDDGFVRTYNEIVKVIEKTCPDTNVVVQSLLPVLFPYIDNKEIRALNTELKALASEEKAVYLDLHSLFLDGVGMPNAGYLMDDGVHVSDAGYSAWSAEVEKLLL
jgi:lysophospholipase L1-like esterase